MRIAMWSGPRNLSTAMMYAFAARGDCAIRDEPFYAAYLARTGLDHPMREAIIASGETDPARIAARLTGPAPGGKAHFYQKHMCQHMIEGIPRGWMTGVTNVFLIRHPARVLASFADKYRSPTLADLGFVQQAELFDQVAAATGAAPLVIDSADIRTNPEAMLHRLCAALGLAFTPAMLRWPPGGHPDDGPWAPVWYGAVHRSTGFAGPEGPLPVLPDSLSAIADAALPHYQRLASHRLLPDPDMPRRG
ncbi:sulfotransferase-like domain-containing protein [Rhodovulum strictum]|uniref:HAD family hydrolase n=1 Tax=Rhodovulum strictum TaxID=58314 RepID=A0A844BB39_9RHOB|nr:HAD family hydrolase [Rhodovulum strictum]MRH19868.1 HAD family hydrolase [Rhodovulum strictum]